jgi:hydrogenase maturation protein HypF
MAENDLRPPLLGVAWDGTGYGTDGTIWGGEFLRITEDSFERVAHFRTFPLPGGEAAVREPRRAALGLLYELFGDRILAMEKLIGTFGFTPQEIRVVRDMLRQGVNSPRTSSVGRLFDAIAALTGIRSISRFEGQAAMELEFALEGIKCDAACPFHLQADRAPMVIDWEPLVREIIADVSAGASTGQISAKFHNALAQIIVTVAQKTGLNRVALSGGCFQNRYLTERTVHDLTAANLLPYWHQRVPPNDGGISLGQVVAASRMSPKG